MDALRMRTLLLCALFAGSLGWSSSRLLSPAGLSPTPRLSQPQLTSEQQEDLIQLPRPLTALERMQRQMAFSIQVLPVIASYLRLYSSFQLRERVLNQCLDDSECEVLWDEQHERGASVVSKAFNDLKARAAWTCSSLLRPFSSSGLLPFLTLPLPL